jgi:hypothetical protein
MFIGLLLQDTLVIFTTSENAEIFSAEVGFSLFFFVGGAP